jgi:hypothetical protein
VNLKDLEAKLSLSRLDNSIVNVKEQQPRLIQVVISWIKDCHGRGFWEHVHQYLMQQDSRIVESLCKGQEDSITGT